MRWRILLMHLSLVPVHIHGYSLQKMQNYTWEFKRVAHYQAVEFRPNLSCLVDFVSNVSICGPRKSTTTTSVTSSTSKFGLNSTAVSYSFMTNRVHFFWPKSVHSPNCCLIQYAIWWRLNVHCICLVPVLDHLLETSKLRRKKLQDRALKCRVINECLAAISGRAAIECNGMKGGNEQKFCCRLSHLER